jgi:hypothetical protein
MINLDTILPKEKDGTLNQCMDKRAYMLTVCSRQAEQHTKIQNLRDQSVLCCGLANTVSPDIDTGNDETNVFPFNMGRPLAGSNLYNPVFFPDAEGNSTLQQTVDKDNFSTCYMELLLDIRVCIQTQSLFFEEGGTPICPYPENITDDGPGNTINPLTLFPEEGAEQPVVSRMTQAKTVKTFLQFNVLCYGSIIDTVIVPLYVPISTNGVLTCFTRQVTIPIKYLTGGCDLNTLQIDSVEGNQSLVYPLGNSEVKIVEILSSNLKAQCSQSSECFIDLKRLIPRTGNCDDPRLFMLGYEHNNSVIAGLVNDTRFTLSRCCDTMDNESFNTCIDGAISNPTPATDVNLAIPTFDPSGDNLADILLNQGLEECNITFSGTYVMCTAAQETNDGAIFPHNTSWSKRLQLFCGATLIDTVDLSFTMSVDAPGETVCDDASFTFEMNWDSATCDINDLVILAQETNFPTNSFAINDVIVSETITDLCADTICLTFDPNN